MKLITYLAIKPRVTETYGYEFAESVELFLEDVSEFSETYFVLNVCNVSDEFYEKWNGNLKGQ